MRKETLRRKDGDQNGLTGTEEMVQREARGCP
jgi:hypothetical protein